jgi:hypothetical protein
LSRALLSENLPEGSQSGFQCCRSYGSGAFYKAAFVNRTHLIEQDEALLAAVPYCNAEWCGTASGGHGRDDGRAQMIVHLGRRDDHAAFLIGVLAYCLGEYTFHDR